MSWPRSQGMHGLFVSNSQLLVHCYFILAADIVEKNESLLRVSLLALVMLQTSLMFGAPDNMWSLLELLWFDTSLY